MKKVRILVAGKYADFKIKPGLIRASLRAVGEEVEFPDWYADYVVGKGLAEFVTPVGVIAQQIAGSSQPVQSARASAEEIKVDSERHTESVSAADVEDLERIGIIQPKRGSRKSS